MNPPSDAVVLVVGIVLIIVLFIGMCVGVITERDEQRKKDKGCPNCAKIIDAQASAIRAAGRITAAGRFAGNHLQDFDDEDDWEDSRAR